MQKIIKNILIIFLVSFAINLVWEVWHSQWYAWKVWPLVNDVYFYVPRIFEATLGDGLLISMFVLGNSWSRKGMKWLQNPERGDYIYIFVVGIITALVIEWYATYIDLWHYNESMPVLFGVVGLSPFIQLAITGVLTVFLVSRLVRRS